MKQKEKKEAREAILFQARMYLEVFAYFQKEVGIEEMAHRLASDFLRHSMRGFQEETDRIQCSFFFSQRRATNDRN